MAAKSRMKFLTVSISNPKSRYKDGERAGLRMMLKVPLAEVNDRRVALADQIEQLMVELLRNDTPATEAR